MERELLEYLEKEPIPGWVNLIDYFRNKYPTNYNEIAKDLKVLLDELVVERKWIYLSHPTDYKYSDK